jgi:hypothetical protein
VQGQREENGEEVFVSEHESPKLLLEVVPSFDDNIHHH